MDNLSFFFFIIIFKKKILNVTPSASVPSAFKDDFIIKL